MDKNRTWEFTCKNCGGHELTVRRVWITQTGPESETWQEWGLLKPDHLWSFEFKGKVDQVQGDKSEEGDFSEFSEDDSDSEPENYETFEVEENLEGDEFYVNCADCDREIEFGWGEPNRGGGIFPVECSDFKAGEIWPEPRYSEAWQQKNLLPGSNNRH